MKSTVRSVARALVVVLFVATAAMAHDPVFGPGPHTLFKNGFELAFNIHSIEAGASSENEFAAELAYGLTGNWTAGIEIPYLSVDQASVSNNGLGDIALFSKYRFWRRDGFGSQTSAAVIAKVLTESGDDEASPGLGTGTTDAIIGLTYGYEGRKWYRWSSVRYRVNGKNASGLRRGDKWLVDIAGGWRPTLHGYREPDTVWLLEINGEVGGRSKLNGVELVNSGGTQWFVSPGIFWTLRNFAVKAGVQIPIYNDMNGNQPNVDFRANLTIEWHL